MQAKTEQTTFRRKDKTVTGKTGRQGGEQEAGSLYSFRQGHRVNRQVGSAAAGAHGALRILINFYISGENDEKGRKIDERELEQTQINNILSLQEKIR